MTQQPLSQPPSPLPPISPQPEGPLRQARIDALLSYSLAQVHHLDLSSIASVLGEISEYEDGRLCHLQCELKRQKRIKNIMSLQLQDIKAFDLDQINQTLTIVRDLKDNRLQKYIRVLELIHNYQLRKPGKQYKSSKTTSKPFSFLSGLFSKSQKKQSLAEDQLEQIKLDIEKFQKFMEQFD